MEKIGKIFWPIVSAGILIDQLTKYFITSMQLSQSIPVIKNVFHITYVVNTGAGFGIMPKQTKFLIFVALLVIGLIFYYYKEIKTKQLAIYVSLILAGTVGNLIDRIRFSHVIDFLDFRIWPTFNLADTFVVIGAIGLLYLYWD